MIGVGMDELNPALVGMVQGRVLPWVEDSHDSGYPVWHSWGAVGRSTYFLNRDGSLDTTFDITPYDPNNPEDYAYIKNLILELRTSEGTSIADHQLLTPDGFSLYQNYPNPFNSSTMLHYDLPQKSHVTIVIYDMLGGHIRSIVSGMQDAGYNSVTWDGKDDLGKPVSSGVYLYQIRAGDFTKTSRMVLLK